MAQLVFRVNVESSLSQILEMIVPYMKGLAFERILILADGRQRMVMDRSDNGYKLFGAVLTPEKIRDKFLKNRQ